MSDRPSDATVENPGQQTYAPWTCYGLAFASGFITMALEIGGARVMAPTFGLSVIPWTAMIGVVLVSLAAGNAIGGRLADSRRVSITLVLFVAGICGFIPVLAYAFPQYALSAHGFTFGAVVSAAALFAPPVLALGTLVPFLISYGSSSLSTIGTFSGNITAVATFGSVTGTFVTGFVLIPLLPTPLLLSALASSTIALGGLVYSFRARHRWIRIISIVGVAGYGALSASRWSRPAPDVLYVANSLHSTISVRRHEGAFGPIHALYQNAGASSTEYVDTGESATEYVHAAVAVIAPSANAMRSALVLGGAAMSQPVELRRAYPNLLVETVELDPKVTEVARRFFAFGKVSDSGIRVVHEDARIFLSRSTEQYDVIFVDVFDHFLSVPWPLITSEALALMKARLTPGGIVVVNILTAVEGNGAELLGRLVATAKRSYPIVEAYSVQDRESPLALRNVLVICGSDLGNIATDQLHHLTIPRARNVLTDAFAPVEYLQARSFVGGLQWN